MSDVGVDKTVSENHSNDETLKSAEDMHMQNLESKTFAGIPKEWHETIKVKN